MMTRYVGHIARFAWKLNPMRKPSAVGDCSVILTLSGQPLHGPMSPYQRRQVVTT